VATESHSNDPAHEEVEGLTLVRLGLSNRERALFAPLAEDGFSLGRVMRADRGMAFVGVDGAVLRAEPAVHLLKATADVDHRVAVGDWVAFARPEGHDLSIIEAILPRSSAFVRKDPGEQTAGQVLAANVDYVLLVQALAPREPNLRRLERELVTAWDSGAQPVVVLNKADLCDEADAERWREEVVAVALGVDVHVVSGMTGEGVEQLAAYARGHKTVALFGPSGVGKSTLINHLVGHDVQAIGGIRESDGKGRHTTVARELVLLAEEGVLIDSPGMRALALWDVADGVSAAFPDIGRFAEECRFRDCAHTNEPGCAVQAAVEAGELDAARLDSYVRLKKELQHLAAKQDVLARQDQTRNDRTLAKTIRRYHKEHRQK